MFLRIFIIGAAVLYLTISQTHAQKVVTPSPIPTERRDPFELSVGYNYIHLDDAYPETANLHGVDLSFFYNFNSWIALGGDFMANFGGKTYNRLFGSIDVDSERYVYVFGPRVTFWQDPRFRIFGEVLGGGVHAEATLDFSSVLGSFPSRTASADSFAMAIGGGVDWRFSRHWAWRVVQADYLPTTLGSDWQNNFRASTGVVFSFGGGR